MTALDDALRPMEEPHQPSLVVMWDGSRFCQHCDGTWPCDAHRASTAIRSVTEDATVTAIAEALAASPNGAWLTLPGPVSIAPGLATVARDAVVRVLVERLGAS